MSFCVCINAYNRPLYFSQLLESLSPQVKDIPTYLFIDYPEELNELTKMDRLETELLIGAQISLFQRRIPHGEVHKSSESFGIANQCKKARDYALGRHERALFFADDFIISSYYVEMIRRLMDFLEHDERIGVVSGFGDALMEKEEQISRRKELKEMVHMLGWATWVERYAAALPFIEPFYEMVNGVEYSKRDMEKIRKWYLKQGVSRPFTGEDFATAFGYYKAGFVRVSTLPNHLCHIGALGVNSNMEALGVWHKKQMVHAPTESWIWSEEVFAKCKDMMRRFFT